MLPDLRMLGVGAAAWLGALAGLMLTPLVVGLGVLGVLGVLGLVGLVGQRRAAERSGVRPVMLVGPGLLGPVLVAAALAAITGLRVHEVAANPVAALGRQEGSATLDLAIRSDPRPTSSGHSVFVVVRAVARSVTTEDGTVRLAAPVLVIGGESWAGVEIGSTVRTRGRLVAPDGRDLSAVLTPYGGPQRLTAPAPWWRAADGVRSAIRDSVARVPEPRRILVPALVDGDDAGIDERLAADFKTTGLTHLLAVSGTNLTLVLGFVLVLARWAGVRGRWRYVVAASGIVGFVLLARPEPSVLRAAVMGSVALVALGDQGAARGPRTLGVAVTVLLLVDPWLAALPGFALSVLATGGIVLLAPGWRDALMTWLPRWAAEAVSVPAAAQLACAPVVAALSGQVSLVSVPANLLAAPAVGPATVIGLVAGLVGLVVPAIGRLLGAVAGWCVGWIALVAQRFAGLPTPAVEWATGPGALALLSGACLAVAVVAPRLLRRRRVTLVSGVLLLVVVLVRPPVPGWPPAGWLLVACDVGQGDALALATTPGSAVVVDAGPDPTAVDRCLARLGVRRIPLLVLTHFHADHIDGLSGVLAHRRVGGIMVTALADPPEGADQVAALARRAGVPVTVARYAATRQVGPVTFEVLWPLPDQPTTGPGDGSTANNASVVLLAQVHGVRLLLTGDVEPEGQQEIARAFPDLAVDVLKVPHHGSRYQDLDFLLGLGARVALVSVGADNDYGHPATATLDALAGSGARVLRTDTDGDLAVLLRDGRLYTRTSR